MEIICVLKDDVFKGLTVGKSYKIETEVGGYYTILNDLNRMVTYSKRYFGIKDKIGEVLMKSITFKTDNYDNDFIKFNYGDCEDLSSAMSSRQCSASCGILDISGLNRIRNFSKVVVEDLGSKGIYVSRDLIVDIAIFKYLEGRKTGAYFLLSNYVNPTEPSYFQMLDALSLVHTQEINKNSKNLISIWLLKDDYAAMEHFIRKNYENFF